MILLQRDIIFLLLLTIHQIQGMYKNILLAISIEIADRNS